MFILSRFLTVSTLIAAMAAFSMIPYGTNTETVVPSYSDTVKPSENVMEAVDLYVSRFGELPYGVAVLPEGKNTIFHGTAMTIDGQPIGVGEDIDLEQFTVVTGETPVMIMSEETGKVSLIPRNSIFAAKARIPRQPNQDRTFVCWVVCRDPFMAFCDDFVCLCIRIGDIPQDAPPPIQAQNPNVVYTNRGNSCFIRWPRN